MKSNTLLLIALLIAPLSMAESVEQMLQKMTYVQQNPEELAKAVEQGKERGRLCFSCHGEDGNSKRDYIPNLASQNAEYLFTQFEHFADGTRKDYVMSKLAKQLSADDRVAIALYFSQHEVKPRGSGVVPAPEGQQLYQAMCFACHGETGHGSSQYPRIAGQPYEYLEKTLIKFHDNDPERAGSPMVAVAKNLKESQIKAVASYITHMP